MKKFSCCETEPDLAGEAERMTLILDLKTYLLLLVPLASGCTINQDLLTAGEQETTGTTTDPGDPTGEDEPTGAATDPGDPTGEDEPTGCGETDCPQIYEPSNCLRELAWNGQLIGLTRQTVAVDDHETVRTILAHVDPDTHALTPFAEGLVGTDSRTMVLGPDGAIYTGGNKGALFEGDATPQWLQKYSPEGVLLWSVRPEDNGETVSTAVDLALLGDELVVIGEEGELRGRSTASGALLWELPATDGARFRDAEVDGEGALHVIASAPSGSEDMPEPGWSIRKYAADRTLLWEDIELAAEPGGFVGSSGFAFDGAGGLILALTQYGSDPKVRDTRLRKYDTMGTEVWTRALPGLEPQESIDRFYTRPGGGVIAIGPGLGDDNPSGAVTIAFDPEGALLWVDRQAHPELSDVRNNAAVIVDGTVMVSGCGLGPPSSDTTAWMLKLAL